MICAGSFVHTGNRLKTGRLVAKAAELGAEALRHGAPVGAVQNEARALLNPVFGQFRRLVVNQRRQVHWLHTCR